MSTLLSTRSLQVQIGKCRVCEDLHLTVAAGESWGILGVNGVGKTTLLHTLAGLRLPHQGTVCYNDTAIDDLAKTYIAQHRGILFQEKTDPFPATVLESVLIGRHPYIGHWQWESGRDVSVARQSLRTLGLTAMENQLINRLSGGERQRVAIAALLAQQVKLFLLDEPTNHLDLKQQMRVMQLFAKMVQRENCATVAIIHDINIAARYCDHILMLFGKGEFMQGRREDILKPDLLAELYGYPITHFTVGNQQMFIPA